MIREAAARAVLALRSLVLWAMGGGAWAEGALHRLAQRVRRSRAAGHLLPWLLLALLAGLAAWMVLR